MNTTRNTVNKAVMARITRNGKLYQCDFTLKEYITWENAEVAAQRWVRNKLKFLPPKRSMVKGANTTRNTSGFVGITRKKMVNTRSYGHYEYWSWIARWPSCPNPGGITWTTNKVGDDEAFVLAVLSRRLESIDRDKIRAEFSKIQGTEAYDEIIRKKRQDAPESELRTTSRSWKRDHVADVVHPGTELDDTLEAQAEASVGDVSKTPQV